MIKANKEHKGLIVDLLVNAFADNQSVNYIVCQDNDRLRRIAALMDYSFEMCLRFGEVWLSENQEASALILFPHEKENSLSSIWLAIKLILQAIGVSGIAKAVNREAKVKNIQPKRPMAYLWFIGVNRASQHSGHGSQLLREIIDRNNKKGLSVYLETSTVTNLPWYQSLGFEIYNEIDFGYKLYFLKR